MRDFYKILEKLTERKVYFCFQYQDKSNFYNLSVNDPKGVNHSLSFDSIDKLQHALLIIWGHLLVKSPSLPSPF